jgi:enediyne biosynthesis protein E4
VAVAIGLAALLVLAVAAVAALALRPVSAPSVAAPAPRFVEEAVAAGVGHAYDGDYPFVVGGGVAAFDCDDDGRQDLFFAGGEQPAALFRNVTPAGGPFRFEEVASTVTDLTSVTGAYPLDLDGDVVTDLVVLRRGENVILRGLGGCRFERANETLGIDGDDGMTVAFSATWEGDATLPTLAFGDYTHINEDDEATYTCPDGTLVRPSPEGGRYAPPVRLAPGWCPLSMLFSDWDRSGRRDLRVSNDRHYYRDGEEQLWRIEPDAPPTLYTRDDGWMKLQLWGMGIATQDLTGDGYPEVYLTSQGDNKLQTLADGPTQPTYEDIALRRGATAHRPYAGGDILPSTAWHPAFEDVNNDGFTDLFVSKGNVEGQTDHAMKDPSNLLIGQPDGTFIEGASAAGMTGFGKARGVAVVDLDRDGLLDIVKVIRRQNVEIWRNLGAGVATNAAAASPMGHWLGVELHQDRADRDGIGAWIAVRIGDVVKERERTVGGGHASGQLGPVHFGLGPAERADVRVTWPDGEVGPWMAVDGDQTVRIERGADAPVPVKAAP